MRQSRRVKNGYEYSGDILLVRAVEDCIRATKRYTESIGTMRHKHPIQGEDFQSRVFCKRYEVFPDIDIDEKMNWWKAALTTSDWLWGDNRIDMLFNYDYRDNKASIVIEDGKTAIKELGQAIPGFSDALASVIMSKDKDKARSYG